MRDQDPFSNEGRDSEECRRASVAALLGPLLWARDMIHALLSRLEGSRVTQRLEKQGSVPPRV